jgi:hypothetical protein
MATTLAKLNGVAAASIAKINGISVENIAKINGIDMPASGPITATELNFNGTNGSTTITDETGKTWTAYGNAQLDTSWNPEGTASLELDGSSSYISTPYSADFNLAANDWKISFYIKENGAGGCPNNAGLISGPGVSWMAYWNGSLGKVGFKASSDGVSYGYPWDSSPLLTSSYVGGSSTHLIEITRTGDVFGIAVDSAAPNTVSAQNSGQAIYDPGSGDIYIGKNDTIYANCWIDAVKIVNGSSS